MAKQTFRSIQTKPEPFWTPLPIQLHLAQSIKVWSLTPVHGSPQGKNQKQCKAIEQHNKQDDKLKEKYHSDILKL